MPYNDFDAQKSSGSEAKATEDVDFGKQAEKLSDTGNRSENPKWVYILKLGEGNYYVGSSGRPRQRIAEQREGKGAAWVDIHGVEGVQMCAGPYWDWPYVERNVTLFLMDRVGVERVRGGRWTRVNWDRQDDEGDPYYPEAWELDTLDTDAIPGEVPLHFFF